MADNVVNEGDTFGSPDAPGVLCQHAKNLFECETCLNSRLKDSGVLHIVKELARRAAIASATGQPTEGR